MPTDGGPGPKENTDVEGLTASAATVTSALAGLAGAWIAAGSVGLMAHPLRHAFMWVALAIAILAARPAQKRWTLLALAIAGVLGLPLLLPCGPVFDVLAVGLILALLARGATGLRSRVLLVTALAVGVLGIVRLACVSIPSVWLVADALGCLLGHVASGISGRPLWVGATFGGVDFLVLMLALTGGWLWATERPRRNRALYALAAIVAGQILYLVLLSFSTDWLAALPERGPLPEPDPYVPPDWYRADALGMLLPWNLPALALLIHLGIAGAMFRWVQWRPVGTPRHALRGQSRLKQEETDRWGETAAELGAVVLAVLIPALTVLSTGSSDLSGKTVVAYRNSRHNWAKPAHDRYGWRSAGHLGMLGPLVESLGGEFRVSSDLAESDLAEADVLLVVHPTGSWPNERLERVWDFVRDGGSLLVAAGPRVQEGDVASSFNDVLKPAGATVRFDVALPRLGNWEQSYEALSHPATLGSDDRRYRFGLFAASSLSTSWPARPVLVGRWGWSDPGSDAVLTDVYQYDPGEKLGDLVLAAEGRLESGRVFVLGDTFALMNENIPDCYQFTGRLLGYLAGDGSSPQIWWRQLLGVLASAGLIGLLVWRPDPSRLGASLAVLGVVLATCTAIGHHKARVLPDGRSGTFAGCTRLAYIDASHMESYSDDNWSDDGIAGLKLTLMRNGYLPLLLGELAQERLERADLLISVAPLRAFSSEERRTVRDFVESGGLFVCTVGAEESGASRQLLEGEFELSVPPSPVPPGGETREPEPMGARFTHVETDGHRTNLFLYAGWPVEDASQGAEVMVRAVQDQPVVISRQLGRGRVILIGDTGFAMNKSLEHVTGRPIYGKHANSNFWRWLLTGLNDQPDWTPPPSPQESPPSSPSASGEAAADSSAEEDQP